MPIRSLSRRPPRQSLPTGLLLEPGTYLTDELHLFRCVSVGPADEPNATALLEDCRTLAMEAFPIAELNAADLRIVQPAA
jgi:hypothetical protein